jgi:hypothetical protein
MPCTDANTNLTLTKEEFLNSMLCEPDGLAMLDLLEAGEWRVCERLGLVRGYRDEHDDVCFDVPSWDALVAHLRIVNSV